MPLHFFGSKCTISHFGECFREGQYSLVSFLFAVLLFTVPPRAQLYVKVGARAPVPYGVGATASTYYGDEGLCSVCHCIAKCLALALSTDIMNCMYGSRLNSTDA